MKRLLDTFRKLIDVVMAVLLVLGILTMISGILYDNRESAMLGLVTVLYWHVYDLRKSLRSLTARMDETREMRS